jgi:spermidine synthase
VHPVRRLGEAARDRAPFAVKWGDTGDMPHRQQARTGLAVQADVASGVAELVADADRPRAWTLRVDGIPQSHVDLDDPEYLEFEYMRRLGHVADLAGPAGQPLRVLHLGGGALTLARYVAATRPGSDQLAVEADETVADLVRRRLPLRQPARSRTRTGRIRVRVADARAVLESVAAGSFDLVVADVFAGAQTPAHLTSAEFLTAASRALRPAGIFTANIGDGPPLEHARRRVATVRAVFADRRQGGPRGR